ncbi:MAG: hypothetical protein Q7S43_02825 [bacterium]|nr:hypothetical protein [bacterium]MDO8496363.1 hypothetical protein [bacterium]
MLDGLFKLYGAKLFYGIVIAFLLGWLGFTPAIVASVLVAVVVICIWLVGQPREIEILLAMAQTVALMLIVSVMWLSYLMFSGKLHTALAWVAKWLPK